MSEWQPIETAPKDETEILVYGEETRTIAGWGMIYSPYGDARRKGWRCEATPDIEGHASDGIEPTHWMPLPAPPREPVTINADVLNRQGAEL